MALVDDILNFLRTHYQPNPGEFDRYDQQALVDKMRLRETGKERGAKNQPASDMQDLDVIEQNIAEAMRKHAMDEETRVRQELSHYSERLKMAHPGGQSAAMFMQAKKAVAGFRKAMLATRVILDKDRQNVLERDREVEDFKAQHGLKRPPQPLKGHWMASFLLAMYLMVEIAINASVLSAGSEYGILGGIIGAFFYTLVSMSLAFILGYFCLPYIGHSSGGQRFFGFVSSLLLIVGIVAVNLLAAHYRVAITTPISGLDAIATPMSEFEAARAAPRNLWNNPMAFMQDMESILMVCVSLVVAFFTAWKGYNWQDPYPGYAKVAKFRNRAYQRWVHAIEDHSDELEDIYQHHMEEIEVLQASLSDRQMSIPQILGNRRRMVLGFNTHIRHIEDVANFMLANYREANCETRETPKPKYFNRTWKLDAVLPMDLPRDDDVGDVGAWKDVGDELRTVSDELNAAHGEAVGWIERLGKSDSAVHVDAGIARERSAEASPVVVNKGRRKKSADVGAKSSREEVVDDA